MFILSTLRDRRLLIRPRAFNTTNLRRLVDLLHNNDVLRLRLIRYPRREFTKLLIRGAPRQMMIMICHGLRTNTGTNNTVRQGIQIRVRGRRTILLRRGTISQLGTSTLIQGNGVNSTTNRLTKVRPSDTNILQRGGNSQRLVNRLIINILNYSRTFPKQGTTTNIMRRLQRNRFGIVHLHTILNGLNLTSRRLLLRLRAPLYRLKGALIQRPRLLLRLYGVHLRNDENHKRFVIRGKVLLFLVLWTRLHHHDHGILGDHLRGRYGRLPGGRYHTI